MNRNLFDKELSYMVSNFDIMKKTRYSNTSVKIIVYSQLEQISDLLQLLPKPLSSCFILIRTSDNSGHWTCICRNYNNIYYFDSYGVKPDGELKNINNDERLILDESKPLLSILVRQLPKAIKFKYNNIQFQSYFKENNYPVNTCGKWTTVFTNCIFNGLTLNQFQTRINQIQALTHLSFDELICLLYDSF